jgi:hypothetical protein
VPLFAPASGASALSDHLEEVLIDGLSGDPKLLAERLRDAADCLEGRPAELRVAGFLTASVYAEAARRNLRHAAASIGLDMRGAVVDSCDDLEALDPLLLEWLS